MRSAVVLIGAIVAAIVAAVRTTRSPAFATQQSYHFLEAIGLSTLHAFIIQVFLLLLIMTLVALAVKKYELPEETLLVLVASPTVIASLVLLDASILIGILALIAILVWKTATRLSIVSALIAITGSAGAFLVFLIAGTLAFRRKFIHAAILAVIACSSILYYWLPTFNTDVFAELGVLGGQSIFILLLAIAGIVLWWQPTTYPRLFAATIAVFIGMYIPDLRFIVAILAAGLAGYAVHTLTSRKWTLTSIKNASMLLVVCGLLFTAASTGAGAVRADPNSDFLEVQSLLLDLPPAKVLAAPGTREVLKAIHVPVSEPEIFLAVNARRNIDETRGILPKYVILEDDTKAENLRFMIENTDDFLKIHDSSIDIWLVK